MPNVIKQIVKEGQYGTQSVRMIVKSNERGPKGDQGEPGATATIEAGNAYSVPTDQNPAVINSGTASEAVFDFYIPKGETGAQGPAGKDGVVQYTAGAGIKIKDNVISAIGGGGGGGEWGYIEGDIADQTDLQQEFGLYTKTADLATVATTGAYSDLTGTPTIPAAQVQSDWTQADNTKVDYIKNKPSIPTVNDATITFTNNGTTVDSFTTNAGTAKTIALSAPVITMTTTDPGEGSALAANNFVATYGSTTSLDYSLSETDTGLTWVDGSVIYKKTINTGALPNNSNKSVSHGITNLHRVIKLEGYAYYPNTPTSYPLPFPSHIAVGNVIDITVDATNVVLSTGVDRSNLTESYVTIYYIKSA